MQETQTQSLGLEDPLEREMAHSSIFAWRILWTEEPDGLTSMELGRVGHHLETKNKSNSKAETNRKYCVTQSIEKYSKKSLW